MKHLHLNPRHWALAFTALILSCLNAQGSDSSPAYNFLNIPSSTTSWGLGGLNISTVDDDVNNIDANPALLGPEMEQAIGINYMHYIGGSNFAGVKFANGIGQHAAYGVGVQYFGYGSMNATDVTGASYGEFSPMDLALTLYYSHDITDYLRGGVALKTVYSSYEQYTAWAMATDLGLNYYDPDCDLSLSLTVVNLGGQIKRFNEAYDRMPTDIRLGWTKSFGDLPFRFSATAWNLTKWKLPYYEAGDGTTSSSPEIKSSFSSNLFRHLIFAADFIPSDRFHIGIGYNYKTRTDMSTYSRSFLSGFSIGCGLRTRMLGIGVALAQPHTGATTVMFNITTSITDFIR